MSNALRATLSVISRGLREAIRREDAIRRGITARIFQPSLPPENRVFATTRLIAAVSRTSRAVSSQILTSLTVPQKKYKAVTCKQRTRRSAPARRAQMWSIYGRASTSKQVQTARTRMHPELQRQLSRARRLTNQGGEAAARATPAISFLNCPVPTEALGIGIKTTRRSAFWSFGFTRLCEICAFLCGQLGIPGSRPTKAKRLTPNVVDREAAIAAARRNDGGVDVVRAFVGDHRFQVHHVAHDGVVVGDAVGAQDVARDAGTFQGHPHVVALDEEMCSWPTVPASLRRPTCSASNWALEISLAIQTSFS